MRIAVTYTLIPDYGELSSLHFQYQQHISPRAGLWIHLPGQVYANGSARPWWLDYGEQASEPELLNEQTTRIIINMIKSLKPDAVPDFGHGAAGDDDRGTLRELEFLAGFNRVKYVWWEELPPQWTDFGSILAFFDGFIDARRNGAG